MSIEIKFIVRKYYDTETGKYVNTNFETVVEKKSKNNRIEKLATKWKCILIAVSFDKIGQNVYNIELSRV